MTELNQNEIDSVDGAGVADVALALYDAVRDGLEIGYAIGYWLGSH